MTTTESNSRTTFALHERHRDHGLARRELGHWEVFAQSLAATGPSIAIAGTIPLSYLLSGNGAVLSFVLATAHQALRSTRPGPGSSWSDRDRRGIDATKKLL
jgi:hypothetical protein